MREGVEMAEWKGMDALLLDLVSGEVCFCAKTLARGGEGDPRFPDFLA